MKKILLVAVLASLTASLALAQAPATTDATGAPQTGATTSPSTSSQPADTSNQAPPAASTTPASEQMSNASNSASDAAAATVQAQLTKTIDAKKAKQGDEVVAKTTEDLQGSSNLTIPKNSKLIGHVAEVQARAGDQGESRIVIVFDKAVPKGGQEIPIQATIQAIAAPERAPMPTTDMMAGSASDPGGAPVGGASGAATGTPATTGAPASTPGIATGASQPESGSMGTSGSSRVALDSTSKGVMGIEDLQLAAGNTGQTLASQLKSSSRNVKLENGTRMVLRISAQ